MNMQYRNLDRWCSGMMVILLWGGYAAASPADAVLGRLLEAVRADDTQAYVRARDAALALPDEQFPALLAALQRQSSWQAMAMRDGLRLRREHPEVAADFDVRLRAIVANPFGRIDGSSAYRMRAFPDSDPEQVVLLDSREHDILRFEALLAWKCAKPVRPREDTLRQHLLSFRVQDAASLDRYIALLRSMPQWIGAWEVAGYIYGASLEVGAVDRSVVDRHVPELIEQYRRFRGESGPEPMGVARLLAFAIWPATDEVRLPAVRGLIEFERGAMTARGLTPWQDDDEALRRDLRAGVRARDEVAAILRRTEDGQAAESLRREVVAADQRHAHVRLRLAARSLWQTLEEIQQPPRFRSPTDPVYE